MAAYAVFLFARRAVRDDAAAWVAGVAFGFAPFMSARATEHFSLVQTAPLVLFAHGVRPAADRARRGASRRGSA